MATTARAHVLFLLSVIVCLAPVLKSDAARVEPGTSLDEAAAKPFNATNYCEACKDPKGLASLKFLCAFCFSTTHEALLADAKAINHPPDSKELPQSADSKVTTSYRGSDRGSCSNPGCKDPKELPQSIRVPFFPPTFCIFFCSGSHTRFDLCKRCSKADSPSPAPAAAPTSSKH